VYRASELMESPLVLPELISLADELSASLKDGTFVRMTLSKYRGSAGLRRAIATRFATKQGERFSWQLSYERRDERKNLPIAEAPQSFLAWMNDGFRAAHLFTTEFDVSLVASKRRSCELKRSAPTFSGTAPAAEHNAVKNYPVPLTTPFLPRLGICTPDGRLRHDRADKFKQLNKFVEIIATLIRQAGVSAPAAISVVDFGCGRSYLTFGLHHHLTTLGFEPAVVGIEAEQKMVREVNAIASDLEIQGLTFRSGQIRDTELPSTDMVVALHACDTATDDAIWSAVKARARIIAVAPCCHKYVRPRMVAPGNLQPLLSQGIAEERFAELLTNGLRALYLEAAGYETKIFEFVSGSHTAKNIMISGVLRNNERRAETARKELDATRQQFGLTDFYLDTL
jgi:Methyltransferase domain